MTPPVGLHADLRRSCLGEDLADGRRLLPGERLGDWPFLYPDLKLHDQGDVASVRGWYHLPSEPDDIAALRSCHIWRFAGRRVRVAACHGLSLPGLPQSTRRQPVICLLLISIRGGSPDGASKGMTGLPLTGSVYLMRYSI